MAGYILARKGKGKIFAIRRIQVYFKEDDGKLHVTCDFSGDKKASQKFLKQLSESIENVCLKYDSFTWVKE